MFAGDREENFQFIIFLLQFFQSPMNIAHFVGQTNDFVLLFEIRIGLLQQLVLQLLNIRIGTCYEEKANSRYAEWMKGVYRVREQDDQRSLVPDARSFPIQA